MTTTELIVVFAAAMLAIAVVAIAVDWVGKPIRRRFIPRMYRFPEEMPQHQKPATPDPSLTGWSDQYFVIPEQRHDTGEHMLEWPDVSEWDEEAESPAYLEAPVPVLDPDPPYEEPPTLSAEDDPSADEPEPVAAPKPSANASDHDPERLPTRSVGWKRGDYVYNFVGNGSAPSADIVRTRFWKNISATDHVAIFGHENEDRMKKGRAPRRRNPRTGEEETMSLPVESFEDCGGRPPHPRWPEAAVDPFGEQ